MKFIKAKFPSDYDVNYDDDKTAMDQWHTLNNSHSTCFTNAHLRPWKRELAPWPWIAIGRYAYTKTICSLTCTVRIHYTPKHTDNCTHVAQFLTLTRTGSLGAPDVNSTNNNQPWKKPAVGSRPGSILAFQDLRLTSTLPHPYVHVQFAKIDINTVTYSCELMTFVLHNWQTSTLTIHRLIYTAVGMWHLLLIGGYY